MNLEKKIRASGRNRPTKSRGRHCQTPCGRGKWIVHIALVGVRANEKNHQSSLIKIEHVGADANMSERCSSL
jgi:hypothetical protein